MKKLLLTALLSLMLSNTANAQYTDEVEQLILDNYNKIIQKDNAYLIDNGYTMNMIKEDVSKNKSSYPEDEIYTKWFNIVKYCIKDNFESMPIDMQKNIFKTKAYRQYFLQTCKKSKEKGVF